MRIGAAGVPAALRGRPLRAPERGGGRAGLVAPAMPAAQGPSSSPAAGRAGAQPPQQQLYEGRRARLECPACGSASFRGARMLRHMELCCPDLVDAELAAALRALDEGYAEADAAGGAARPLALVARARALLGGLVEAELALRRRSLRAKHNGGAILADAEVGAALGVPAARAARLVARARRDIPLVADREPIEVLYEDEHVIAVNKPPHLRFAPIHRWQGGSVVNRVISHVGSSGGPGGTPHVVHRLDMDTSGAAILAKDPRSASSLHRQFRERTVFKMYTAICHGDPGDGAAAWTVDAPLAKAADDGTPHQAVAADGKPARTRVEVRARAGAGGGHCLVRAFPETGRTHQIRVHLHHSGHPIIGDTLYAPADGRASGAIARHALHASVLELAHPATGRPLRVVAPLPADMLDALGALGIPAPDAPDA